MKKAGNVFSVVEPKTILNDAAFKENNASTGEDVYITIAFNGVHGPFFLPMLLSSLCLFYVLPKLTLESSKS